MRLPTSTFCLLPSAFFLLSSVLLVAQTKSDPRALKNPVVSTAKSIKDGKVTFERYCKSCHGADARGEGPMAPPGSEPPNLIDDSSAYGSSDGEIYSIIRNGSPMPRSDMRAFKSQLADDEIWSVVNYLQSLTRRGR